MKKLFTLIVALMASAGTMFAEKIIYDVLIDGLYYILSRPEDAELEEGGLVGGDYSAQLTHDKNNEYDTLTIVNIPDTVLYEGDAYTVRSIGVSAFYDCSNLVSVTIPNTVLSIINSAFANCSSLTSIDIPNSVLSISSGAFSGCTALTEIRIPQSVTTLGEYAFRNCSNLASIEMSENITKIQNYTFQGCSNLTSITIPRETKQVAQNAFENCSGLKTIYWNAMSTYDFSARTSPFYNISRNITSISFGERVASIPNYLCDDMTNVKSITFHSGISRIGYYSFSSCNPDTIYFIGSIGEWCTKVWSPKSITYSKYTLYINNEQIEDIVIPDNITAIAAYAFVNCANLKSVICPNSISSIGTYAFSYCQNLTSILLPDQLNKIEEYTFSDCSNLTSIVIPESMTSIGKNAFAFCTNLTTIYAKPTTPPSITSTTFTNINSNAKVMVPFGYSSVYKSDKYWGALNIQVDIKQELSVTPTTCTIRFSYNDETNIVELTGLEPNTEYVDTAIILTSKQEETETVNVSFKTPAITLTTEEPKILSSSTAILLATTNLADIETSCGFEWKPNNAPAGYKGVRVSCPVANGSMKGRLKGLQSNAFYEYRAFYQSKSDSMYYGDWQYIYTGAATVEFEPDVYTYPATKVKETEATLKGYAIAGADDFEEQGFEYWADSRVSNAQHAPAHMKTAIGEHHTVPASGISMTVTLTGLDAGTVYKYRTYAKSGSKIAYGNEMSFTTQGVYNDATAIDQVTNDPTPVTHKILRNGQIIILRGDKVYTITGHEVRFPIID